MPKVSKEKKELTERRVPRFYLERLDTQKKLVVVSGLLQSILKTRSTNKKRKDNYIEKLENCFKVLCSHSTDLLESKEKLKIAQKEIGRQNDLRSECQDNVITLERKLRGASEYKARFHQERELKYKAEEDIRKNLSQINNLEKQIEELKTKNEKLEKSIEELKTKNEKLKTKKKLAKQPN